MGARCGIRNCFGRSKSPDLRDCGRLLNLRFQQSARRQPTCVGLCRAGLHEYLRLFRRPSALQTRDDLAHRLLDTYASNHSPEWHWFEDVLAYSNARLPQALITCAVRNADQVMLAAGLESLDWIVTMQRCDVKGHLCRSDRRGFTARRRKGALRSTTRRGSATVSACLERFARPR